MQSSSLIRTDILVSFLGATDFSTFNPQGRLAGVGGEDLPTIVVVAHYDSFGVAPVSLYKPLNVFIYLTQLMKCPGNDPSLGSSGTRVTCTVKTSRLTVNLSCPVAVLRRRLKRQRRLHVARARSSLLQTLHVQKDPRWVSNDEP